MKHILPLARTFLCILPALLLLCGRTEPADAATYERKGPRDVLPPPASETHLAIAMGGAVSLGAFEAGILAELTRQLALYNARTHGHRYVIDVLAGASAGSMSLAILANEMYEPSWDLRDPAYADSSVFYEAWVQRIDVRGLIDPQRGTRDLEDDPYIFDASDLYSIANLTLGSTLALPADSVQVRGAASRPARPTGRANRRAGAESRLRTSHRTNSPSA